MTRNYAFALWIIIGLILMGLLAGTLYLVKFDRESRPVLQQGAMQRTVSPAFPVPESFPILRPTVPSTTLKDPAPLQEKNYAGVAALIVDDVGMDLALVDALLEIGEPLAFSILPHLDDSRAIIEKLRIHGHEVMLHLPMEPLDYPRNNPGPGALLKTMSREALTRQLEVDVRSLFPFNGVNNHMGSALTEDRMRMDWVMDELSRYDVFFVDSLTTPRSIALESARAHGIPCAGRDLFLDNDQDRTATVAQIEKLGSLALRNGRAIGICHPYPSTLQALREALPLLRSREVRLVHVSSLVK